MSDLISHNFDDKYIFDYHSGKLPLGKNTESPFDEYFLHKKGEWTLYVGHENVGKTYWLRWYTLVLALWHNEKFLIYSSEDRIGKYKRDLIQFYHGKRLPDIPLSEVQKTHSYLTQFFRFVNTKKLYTWNEIFEMFSEDSPNYDTAIIDPYNSIIPYEGNRNDRDLKVLNKINEYVLNTNKTLYLSAHVNSEARRRRHPKGHKFEYLKAAPFGNDVEGGGLFSSKADNVLVSHRYTNHDDPYYKFATMIDVEKIKDTDTGGKPTVFEKPVLFSHDFYRFKVTHPHDAISIDPIEVWHNRK